LPENDEWVITWGDLGPVYGHQWRNFWGGNTNSKWVKDISQRQWGFPGWLEWLKKRGIKPTWVDQLQQSIEKIIHKPTDRRIIVNAWNPLQFPMMLLPPCHMFYQFNVDTTNKKLNLQMYQRSADMFLWVPFNIASYSTMLLLIAKLAGLQPGEFIHTLWDVHIYKNHFEQVQTQLSREPKPWPELKINKEIKTLKDIENLEWEDFELVWYDSHWAIKAPVAV
jgi:thymidylate synthase